MRSLFGLLMPDEPPLELQIIGRTLMHAALVGLLAGVIGCAFLEVIEKLGQWLLVDMGGYNPLRTASDVKLASPTGPFRWYWLAIIPAIGGLVAGLASRYAPEIRGGGGDAAIAAFHHENGVIRRRVLWSKPLASIGTLATGGAGGREGPTMQIGAAIGSLIGRYLALSQRERRTLMVSGVAAGISAVFRTPLGAALLAIEVLYRDDFESEALIPAVLSSVLAYSVALSVFGSEPLFGTLPRFPFHPKHLPLFIVLALVISVGATLFHSLMHGVQRLSARLPGPEWTRPAIGGLALGLFVVIILLTLDPWLGNANRGLGIFGGGYGAGQLAISGAPWIEGGWTTVKLLLLLAVAKMVAASVTIGSGGSAGDFAPSIAIGGLLGGAFGTAAQLILKDPSIQPGGFALVGMAAFYAGIANTPLAALVMICEVAGSYDLLVPLMLTEAVAMIALRRVNLYKSQPRTAKDSPIHQNALANLIVSDIVMRTAALVTLKQDQSIQAVAHVVDGAADQDVFPVLGADGSVVGLLSAEALRAFVAHGSTLDVAIVADVMVPPMVFEERDDVRSAATRLLKADLRAAPVRGANGELIGFLDQADLVRALTLVNASVSESRG
jgi:CIC family chloride channel protein